MDEYYLLQLWNVTKPKAIASIPFLNRHLKRGREQGIAFAPWLRYQYQGEVVRNISIQTTGRE